MTQGYEAPLIDFIPIIPVSPGHATDNDTAHLNMLKEKLRYLDNVRRQVQKLIDAQSVNTNNDNNHNNATNDSSNHSRLLFFLDFFFNKLLKKKKKNICNMKCVDRSTTIRDNTLSQSR